MGPMEAFFKPFMLFLGAAAIFLIINPGLIIGIISSIVSFVLNSWIGGAIAVLVIVLIVANND